MSKGPQEIWEGLSAAVRAVVVDFDLSQRESDWLEAEGKGLITPGCVKHTILGREVAKYGREHS